MNDTPRRYVLRDLPVAARLVISCFLISVGLGYLSALVQLHFQNASAGKPLPDMKDAEAIYSGRRGISQLERVLDTDEDRPFNGTGTMKPAFFKRSGGWPGRISKRAKKLQEADPQLRRDRALVQAELELRTERDSERLAILEWIRKGCDKKAYEDDSFVVSSDLAKRPIDEEFVGKDANDTPLEPRVVKIKHIFHIRCEKCHTEGQGQPGQYPLDSYDNIKAYCDVETTGGGMSLKKLAQSTHVHLLGFSMLYGLTGLIFAFTSFPRALRVILAPFPLIAQIVDISCWWLARTDPLFAKIVVFSGGAVGAGLLLQIVLGLFNMFGKVGRVVLVLLLITAAVGGYTVKERWIDPYLKSEGLSATAPE
jgi:hypothetical protein